jgi:hypothetical protein
MDEGSRIMFVIPKGKPILTNLNTYYLNIKNLIEHFQGELGSGGVFFNSSAGKGVLFFDEFDVVNGYIQNRDRELSGQAAVEFLLDPPFGYNYIVSVHAMEPEDVYYWTQISSAKVIYDNLSSEFTDISALIQKLKMERLTGYVDVALKKSGTRGMLFMLNGEIVGDSLSWISSKSDIANDTQNELISKVKTEGAVFRVFKISAENIKNKPDTPTTTTNISSDQIINMLGKMLSILEKTVSANKKYSSRFGTMLRQKWLEMADQYPFLDPFADELVFENQELKFSGNADDKQLATAVMLSAAEIVTEHGFQKAFSKRLGSWKDKYNQQIKELGINVPFS